MAVGTHSLHEDTVRLPFDLVFTFYSYFSVNSIRIRLCLINKRKRRMIWVLAYNKVSNVILTQDGGKQLQEGMESNTVVVELDLRLTEAGQESEYCINQVLKSNQERARKLDANQL